MNLEVENSSIHPDTFTADFMSCVAHVFPLLENQINTGGFGADWLYYIQKLEMDGHVFFRNEDKRQLQWERIQNPMGSLADHLFQSTRKPKQLFSENMELFQWMMDGSEHLKIIPLSPPHQERDMNVWVVGLDGSGLTLPYIFPEFPGFLQDSQVTNLLVDQMKLFVKMQRLTQDTPIGVTIRTIFDRGGEEEYVLLQDVFDHSTLVSLLTDAARVFVKKERVSNGLQKPVELGSIFFNPRWLLEYLDIPMPRKPSRLTTSVEVPLKGSEPIPVYSSFERWEQDNGYGVRVQGLNTVTREVAVEKVPVSVGQLVSSFKGNEQTRFIENGFLTVSEIMLRGLFSRYVDVWEELYYRIESGGVPHVDKSNAPVLQSAALLTTIGWLGAIVARRTHINTILSERV